MTLAQNHVQYEMYYKMNRCRKDTFSCTVQWQKDLHTTFYRNLEPISSVLLLRLAPSWLGKDSHLAAAHTISKRLRMIKIVWWCFMTWYDVERSQERSRNYQLPTQRSKVLKVPSCFTLIFALPTEICLASPWARWKGHERITVLLQRLSIKWAGAMISYSLDVN